LSREILKIKEKEIIIMMYQIEAIAEDLRMVKAMYDVLGEFADGREFCCKDIPAERKKNYYRPRGSYMSNNFASSALYSLCRKGILEKTRTEDYIYEYKVYSYNTHSEKTKKAVGSRQYYRCVVPNVDEYQKVLAELTFKKILSM
jgi:hypothetical protein